MIHDAYGTIEDRFVSQPCTWNLYDQHYDGSVESRVLTGQNLRKNRDYADVMQNIIHRKKLEGSHGTEGPAAMMILPPASRRRYGRGPTYLLIILIF